MHGSNGFEVIEFVEYLRDKRNIALGSCGIAVFLTVIVSAVLPRLYTAKSSVIIEAPAGNDPRAVLALSSVYLDSLKTYESFAASDTLFQRASARLQLQGPKERILKVSMPASTTVLEIRATLRDPRKAQALAQYIAEQTVELENSLEAKAAGDLIAELRNRSQEARERLNLATRASDALFASTPITTLENEVRDGFDLEFRLAGDLAGARADLADYAIRPDTEAATHQIASTKARIASIERQRRDLAGLVEKQASQFDARKSRRDALEAEVRAARTSYEDATTRLNNALSALQLRGQRLRVIDPGTVPQRPSSPDIWLNACAALLASLMGTFGFLALRFGYIRLLREKSERVYSLA